MRPRQAILLTIGALGAGFLGASVHGVATVNADLERMAPVRHTLEKSVSDRRHRDCDAKTRDGEREPTRARPTVDAEI
jgi:hypothetical protein